VFIYNRAFRPRHPPDGDGDGAQRQRQRQRTTTRRRRGRNGTERKGREGNVPSGDGFDDDDACDAQRVRWVRRAMDDDACDDACDDDAGGEGRRKSARVLFGRRDGFDDDDDARRDGGRDG